MIVALLVEGPLGGEAMSIHSRSVPELLYLAPSTEGTALIAGHMLVGTDQTPPGPWEGRLTYELDRLASDLSPHDEYPEMEQGTAIYAWVP